MSLIYDDDPVPDDELAKMPEGQRMGATFNRQVLGEARDARKRFETALASYRAELDRARTLSPAEAERDLADLLEVDRLFGEWKAAHERVIALAQGLAEED